MPIAKGLPGPDGAARFVRCTHEMARRMTPCKLLLLATCCVGAQDCSQMTFNSNTVVDPVAKYGGRRCRGWPLLAKHFGVEVRATAVVDRCGVGDEMLP